MAMLGIDCDTFTLPTTLMQWPDVVIFVLLQMLSYPLTSLMLCGCVAIFVLLQILKQLRFWWWCAFSNQVYVKKWKRVYWAKWEDDEWYVWECYRLNWSWWWWSPGIVVEYWDHRKPTAADWNVDD